MSRTERILVIIAAIVAVIGFVGLWLTIESSGEMTPRGAIATYPQYAIFPSATPEATVTPMPTPTPIFPKWEDLRVSLSATRVNPTTSKPDYAAFLGGTFAYAFDKATDEGVTFEVQMPHAYELGTNIRPHVHWSPPDANAGNVRWCLEFTKANINAAFSNTSTICTTAAAAGTAHKHQIVSLPEISGSGINSVSTMMDCRFFRDADAAGVEDSYNNDAQVLGVDLHYQADSAGSTQETVK